MTKKLIEMTDLTINTDFRSLKIVKNKLSLTSFIKVKGVVSGY